MISRSLFGRPDMERNLGRRWQRRRSFLHEVSLGPPHLPR